MRTFLLLSLGIIGGLAAVPASDKVHDDYAPRYNEHNYVNSDSYSDGGPGKGGFNKDKVYGNDMYPSRTKVPFAKNDYMKTDYYPSEDQYFKDDYSDDNGYNKKDNYPKDNYQEPSYPKQDFEDKFSKKPVPLGKYSAEKDYVDNSYGKSSEKSYTETSYSEESDSYDKEAPKNSYPPPTQPRKDSYPRPPPPRADPYYGYPPFAPVFGGFPYNYFGFPYNYQHGYPYTGYYPPVAPLPAYAPTKFACKQSGYYYRDAYSFFHCHDKDYTVQHCAPGSMNHPNTYYHTEADKYSEQDFCAINMSTFSYPAPPPYLPPPAAAYPPTYPPSQAKLPQSAPAPGYEGQKEEKKVH